MKDDLKLIVGAIRFIEANLKEKLSLEAIADEVGFSKYYFTRLFAKYTGQSPYDYYRGRKLTETIKYMQHRKCKIIDAAFEFGYSSPEVFARACRGVFDMSPSTLRQQIEAGDFEGVGPISEGYLWFVNHYNVEPSLQILDGVDLVGIGYFASSINESLYNMPVKQLKSFTPSNKASLFKVTWLEKQSMGYMNFIGQSSEGSDDTKAVLVKRLPKMAYLVFDFNIPTDELKYFNTYIYKDYIPSSPYELLSPLQLELHVIEGSHRSSKLFVPVVP